VIESARSWADPRFVYTVAAAAVALLLISIWLLRQRSRHGRQAGAICLSVAIALHIGLILLVPRMQSPQGGAVVLNKKAEQDTGVDAVSFSAFDPDMLPADVSASAAEKPVLPLPASKLDELTEATSAVDEPGEDEPAQHSTVKTVPETLTSTAIELPADTSDVESSWSKMLDDAFASDTADETHTASPDESLVAAADDSETQSQPTSTPPTTAEAPPATVPGKVENDFANRVGSAKEEALAQTGGNAATEASVAAALQFLADAQRSGGAWDSRASGGGTERAPLGTNRGGAGARAETAITGLALLAFMGAGHTHLEGDYADNVYRGLAYLIHTQKPDGSLAGPASVYAANYSHGMASLAMCESAVITRDRSAVAAASRAVAFTIRQQHPSTGGWRYQVGDTGDLSQLGWQAMVLDAGRRAGIQVDERAVVGVSRFLNSVRMGAHGGLASYRPREAPSRTMTAEALATRLLIGQQIPEAEIAEAERYLLQRPPGVGKDNYYYWYYATLALHQLQDDAWQRWNEKLQQRLLATQRSDGSWSADSLWGGYGGTVYTTAMATLCLETYYRHRIRDDGNRIAERPSP
jgi:hypothetical protein